jgi:hypothetical protein
MTTIINATASRRLAPVTGRAYTLPVVRELPPRPIDAPGASGQW